MPAVGRHCPKGDSLNRQSSKRLPSNACVAFRCCAAPGQPQMLTGSWNKQMASQAFVSHITEEATVAARLKSALSRDFLGLLDVFVSSDAESIAADTVNSAPKLLSPVKASMSNQPNSCFPVSATLVSLYANRTRYHTETPSHRNP